MRFDSVRFPRFLKKCPYPDCIQTGGWPWRFALSGAGSEVQVFGWNKVCRHLYSHMQTSHSGDLAIQVFIRKPVSVKYVRGVATVGILLGTILCVWSISWLVKWVYWDDSDSVTLGQAFMNGDMGVLLTMEPNYEDFSCQVGLQNQISTFIKGFTQNSWACHVS